MVVPAMESPQQSILFSETKFCPRESVILPVVFYRLVNIRNTNAEKIHVLFCRLKDPIQEKLI